LSDWQAQNPIRSNFRIITATHKDLHAEVQKGTFGQDLYYRLNPFPIYVHPVGDGQSALISDDPHARTYDGKTDLTLSRLSP